MRLLFLVIVMLALGLMSCASLTDVSTQSIDTTDQHVVIADLHHDYSTNCKLEFLNLSNSLGFKVNVTSDGDGFGYDCDKATTDWVEVLIVGRDENTEAAVFKDGGVHPYVPRQLDGRDLTEFRVFAIARKELPVYDSAVMLVPKGVSVSMIPHDWHCRYELNESAQSCLNAINQHTRGR